MTYVENVFSGIVRPAALLTTTAAVSPPEKGSRSSGHFRMAAGRRYIAHPGIGWRQLCALSARRNWYMHKVVTGLQ